LSRLGISTFRHNRLVVHDLARLQEIGGFTPEYLMPPGADPQESLAGSTAFPQFDDRTAAPVRHPGVLNESPAIAAVRRT
jgi:hypothetical protein